MVWHCNQFGINTMDLGKVLNWLRIFFTSEVPKVEPKKEINRVVPIEKLTSEEGIAKYAYFLDQRIGVSIKFWPGKEPNGWTKESIGFRMDRQELLGKFVMTMIPTWFIRNHIMDVDTITAMVEIKPMSKGAFEVLHKK